MMDSQQNKITKKLTGILLVLYLIVLSWIILFKMQFDISLLMRMNLKSINLIPFAGSLIVNGKADISEIILNIVAFIPLGVYIAMLFPKWSFLSKIAPAFAVSLLYEVSQYIFAIGGSDITDLIGNTLGGVIGVLLYCVLEKVFKSKTQKILSIIAAIGTAITVVFLGLLAIANI